MRQPVYNYINRIGDKYRPHLKNFVIFNDTYLTKYDKVLIDENTGEEYTALEHDYIEDYDLVSPEVMPWANGWRNVKKTIIKFNKIPPLNAKLYIKEKTLEDYRKEFGLK